ncbi:hypothetical protein NDU88_002102 [Pleurodeles waltl]|uniref:Uncharacterized protein n=1 Tax=Pleurodeles waltl TaxID=8319 RepID=A0AAV7TKT8_PLEWA|nr:hypothetical protein NDU88_002102 [Pleurodeles waltl]
MLKTGAAQARQLELATGGACKMYTSNLEFLWPLMDGSYHSYTPASISVLSFAQAPFQGTRLLVKMVQVGP